MSGGKDGDRVLLVHDFVTLLLAHLGAALSLCRRAEEEARDEGQRGMFCLLTFVLRQLALLVVTSRATGLPLALSLGRSANFLRLEVALPLAAKPEPPAPPAPAKPPTSTPKPAAAPKA